MLMLIINFTELSRLLLNSLCFPSSKYQKKMPNFGIQFFGSHMYTFMCSFQFFNSCYSWSKGQPQRVLLHTQIIRFFTPFLHLANQFAKRGHKGFYLLSKKLMLLLLPKNILPTLNKFHLVSIPHVEGLPVSSGSTT